VHLPDIDRLALASELTFVVQGAISNMKERDNVNALLESIQRYFPESTVVLSTWSKALPVYSRIDEIVFSKDPGAQITDDKNQIYHNVNRQILSSATGLNLVKTKYAIKVRNDLIFINDNIMTWLGLIVRAQESGDIPKFGRQRILVTDVTSVRPDRYLQLPFHPCDWIYMGTTHDLINLFDIPRYPQEWMRYFEKNPFPVNWPDSNQLSRFPTESYIWSEYIKKYTKINFDHGSDCSQQNLENSRNFFASELVVVPLKNLGIKSLKHNINWDRYLPMYDYATWRRISRTGNLFPKFGLLKNIFVSIIALFWPKGRNLVRFTQHLRFKIMKIWQDL